MNSCHKTDYYIGKYMSLYENIHKKRKSGRPMRKKGAKGAPTDQDFRNAAKTAKKKPKRTTKKRG